MGCFGFLFRDHFFDILDPFCYLFIFGRLLLFIKRHVIDLDLPAYPVALVKRELKGLSPDRLQRAVLLQLAMNEFLRVRISVQDLFNPIFI